jgi:hypothetical protein
MRRERGAVESHGEREPQKMKVNYTAKQGSEITLARWINSGGWIVGEGRSTSAAVPGRSYENTAGRELRWAPVPCLCLDASTVASGKLASRTGQSGIAGDHLRYSSPEIVSPWIAMHCPSFCVELPVLNDWCTVDFETIRDDSLRPVSITSRFSR